ncbi:MAG: ATP-binding protein [Candidatus Omnitrophica bacterium]|nr:ATP-binding protein [Candidatus Omnitrophota bacterium]
MRRSIESLIRRDLLRKIVLVSGPRQVGKTTLARSLYPASSEYFNFDSGEHRLLIKKNAWKRDCDLVIFDELHKMKMWKRWLKGIYDTEGVKPALLVTGSAKLDTYRKAGDSLAGRFYSYRLHPFSVAEVKKEVHPDDALERIIRLGGFPEPFLKNSDEEAKRWRRSHADRILREDLLDLWPVRDIKGIETLVELLRRSVGGTISYESLGRDLEVSPHTVKQWVSLLESLYIVFVVTPYSRNVARSLLKQPKVYFYDTGAIHDDTGARFENAVAGALLKRLHFLEDSKGEKCSLHYLRDKEKREVDFLVLREEKPEYLIEAKCSDPDVSRIKHFSKFLGNQVKCVLLVKDLKRELFLEGIRVEKASRWLAALEA